MLLRELQLPRRETKLPVLLIFIFLLWHTGPMSQTSSIAWGTKMVSVLQGETVKAVCAQNTEEVEGLVVTLRRNASSVVLCYMQLGNFTHWGDHCTDGIHLEYNNQTKEVCVVMERVSVIDSDVYSCTLDKTIPPPVRTINQSHISLTVSALPVVEVSLASSSSSDKETTLTCSAWDFYPGDIQLSWSKDGQLLTNSTRNDSRFHNRNESYSYISNLTFSKYGWNGSAQFSCQVNHSTLKMPIVKTLTLSQSDKESSDYTWIWIPHVLFVGLSAIILVTFVKLRLKSTVQSSGRRGLPQAAETLPPQESQSDTAYSLLSHYPGSAS